MALIKFILFLTITSCSMIPVPVPVLDSYEFQNKMLYNYWDHDKKDSRSELRDYGFVKSFGRNCELLNKGKFAWISPNIVQGGTRSDYINAKIDIELVNIFKEEGNVVIFENPVIQSNQDFQMVFEIEFQYFVCPQEIVSEAISIRNQYTLLKLTPREISNKLDKWFGTDRKSRRDGDL